jgi:hypothetical protein
MSRQLTLEIFKDECVGDSSGKHNYNLLSLDTEVCNISSTLFNMEDNYFSVFQDLSTNSDYFNKGYNDFFNPNRFNIMTSTVNLLSSYWKVNEFSVVYPLNISEIIRSNPDANSSYNDDTAVYNTTTMIPDDTLNSLATIYLNKYYNPSKYNVGDKINVVFFLYNAAKKPNDSSDSLTHTSYTTEFNYLTRHMFGEFTKTDIHFQQGKIFKFVKVIDGYWNFVNKEIGNTYDTDFTGLKNLPSPRIDITKSDTNANGRVSLNLSVLNNIENMDLFKTVVSTGYYIAGYTDITISINSGVYIYSSSVGIPALLISGFSNGDTIRLLNYGFIVGAGGQGGDGEALGYGITSLSSGEDGGDAILLTVPTTILNQNVIAGGGGGGAGGRSSFNSPSFIKDLTYNIHDKDAGEKNKRDKIQISGGGGGGGGAGYTPSKGGTGGADYPFYYNYVGSDTAYLFTSTAGNNGQHGNPASGGNGGVASTTAQQGGSGGNLGSAGTSTGLLDSRGNQMAPFGGRSGASIRGQSYLNLLTRGTLLGDLKY